MRSITFNFRQETPLADQVRVLKNIRGWPGVADAGHLMPHAARPEIQAMCFAYVTDETDENDIVQRLGQLPEVEVAAQPADRRLV